MNSPPVSDETIFLVKESRNENVGKSTIQFEN